MVYDRYPSQDCSECAFGMWGAGAESLSQRVHACILYGLEIDRDLDAARSIVARQLAKVHEVG